jgi:small subunit ribosomal protein S20
MANTASAKKQAKINEKKRLVNQNRRSDLKSASKKVLDALNNKDLELAKELLREAESKIARASGKNLIKKRSASRKISRLAKKVSTNTRTSMEAEAKKSK